ncbi:MAG TPA: glycosyltransferase family 39 protein, partial [Chthonomonadales bacterium]|nr:glycosyltransferase family 39 protein [Chthonomonadales bacterium]
MILRMVALGSDPYGRLSWSSALLTDEGFYIHNARNVVLFGHPRTDGWNNFLFMPLLHLVQVAVFRLAGVGAVQARSISVTLGLFSLVIFYAALRRALGTKVAAIATMFLALDHVYLLYNRMALLDTPAAFLLICVFYAFGRALSDSRGTRETLWLVACGALLGCALLTRGLAIFMLPAPFFGISLYRQSGEGWKRCFKQAVWIVFGLTVVAVGYLQSWYLPNRAEIKHANHYYFYNQLAPGSLRHLLLNVEHAAVGDDRGMSPYMFRHSPVLFTLALMALSSGAWTAPGKGMNRAAARNCIYLWWWLLSAWCV